MLRLEGQYSYAITRQGDAEQWLNTVRALVSVLAAQHPELRIDTNEQYHICSLILDMFPDEDMIADIGRMMNTAKS